MYSMSNEQHMQRVAPPGELSPSQWDDYKESDEQLAPLPPARAPHVVSRTSRACPAIDTWGSCESMADTFVLARSTICVQPAAKKKPPTCSHCGKTITGRPRHLHNKRICGRCELRHYQHLPPLLPDDSGVAAAAVPRAVARASADRKSVV